MSKVKKLVLSAMLLALEIVLVRFVSIKTPIIRISAGFIPVMLSAVWLGAKWTILVAGLADLIGATFFPSGSYFPGYTLSAVVSATIYGCILYKKSDESFSDKLFLIKLTIACLLVIVLVNGVMNTFWVYITTKSAVIAILPIRIIKQLIMFPIQVATIFFLEKALRKPMNKYIRSEND